jgi:hypothetical protein
MILSSHFDNIVVKAPALRGMRSQGYKLIASVDVAHDGDRSEPMCRIYIGVPVQGILGPPFGFGNALLPEFRSLAIGSFPIVELDEPQIVLIPAT